MVIRIQNSIKSKIVIEISCKNMVVIGLGRKYSVALTSLISRVLVVISKKYQIFTNLWFRYFHNRANIGVFIHFYLEATDLKDRCL
jgi:hypothetical protein